MAGEASSAMIGDETRALEAREAGKVPPRGLGDDPTELELRLVSTAAEFDALQPAWSTLHQDCGARVFQSYEWLRTLWKHVGEQDPRRTLHVVVLAEAGRVVCIAPFQIEVVPALGPLSVRRLEFVGAGLTDYLDVLMVKGIEDRCFERIASHLAAHSAAFDVISLCDIPDDSTVHAGLHQALRRHGFEGTCFVSEQCPQTALKSTWPETLAAFEGRGKHLRERRKAFAQLKQRFKVELEVCRNEEDLAHAVEDFIEMHQRRWTSSGQKGVYAEPAVAAFQLEVARRFFDRGWLHLSFLRVDGARVSAHCSFRHGGLLTVYLTGSGDAGEATKYSPGLAHHWLCMEDLIPQGVVVYDFLRGIEPYKYKCGAVDVPNWTLQLFRSGARLPRAKHAIALLRASLIRRLEKERMAFEHQRRAHGLISAGMARYLRSRVLVMWRDGLTKLRAPEKSLSAERGSPA
jgi:CelD/BcsL family acetyltransferase involved in cellulose biosynthesis